MSEQADTQRSLDRVWDLVEKVGVCMLTTQFGAGLRARPLEARPDRAAGLIWFVTDVRSRKEHEIEGEHHVCLVFIDANEKAYLSITARAEVQRDHAQAAHVWKRTDSVWWNGPDDPNVRVLRVKPVIAELWDGPANSVVTAYEFLKARVIGTKPDLGENRKVTVTMMANPAGAGGKAGSKGPSAIYRRVWQAARECQQITCTYQGRHREASPTIVGYKDDGREAVFVFQFSGESSSKLPNWRCLTLADVTELRVRDGPWYGGSSHSKTQTCIQHVDVDVNIPETLKHRAPLPFGSPKLRPPRRSGE